MNNRQTMKLSESEDASSVDNGIDTYYCRDLIFNDCPDGNDIEVYEIRTKIPVEISQEDQVRVKSLVAKGDLYRIFIYVVKGQCDSRWQDAKDNIDDEFDYKNYVDKDDVQYEDFPEDYDEEFYKKFDTYQKWTRYLGENSKKRLSEIFNSAGRYPYLQMKNSIHTNENGDSYAIIAWRA